MNDNSLPKWQRLSSKVAIERLFAEGNSGFVFPFKYLVVSNDTPCPEQQMGPRILISVSKRYHKRANKRNTIKRRSKEAYRLNKMPLMAPEAKGRDIALLYISKEVENYKTIESALQKIISAIAKGS